jgi:hypothetical protein
MNAGRVVLRAIGGVFALGVAAVVLIPVAAIIAIFSIPVLILLAVGGAVGAAALLGVGLPAIITGVLILVAIAAAAILIGGAVTVGVFVLKVLLFALLLSWLARKVFGWRRPSSSRMVLVGPPVADIEAPSIPRRDKYDIAAERELDEELGI